MTLVPLTLVNSKVNPDCTTSSDACGEGRGYMASSTIALSDSNDNPDLTRPASDRGRLAVIFHDNRAIGRRYMYRTRPVCSCTIATVTLLESLKDHFYGNCPRKRRTR
jgi:hypothetical protein